MIEIFILDFDIVSNHNFLNEIFLHLIPATIRSCDVSHKKWYAKWLSRTIQALPISPEDVRRVVLAKRRHRCCIVAPRCGGDRV